MSRNRTKMLVMIALFVALNVVIVRFLSFQTPTVRVSFGFIPDSLCAMMFGPVIGGIACAMSDLLGVLINSHGMPYFPGFTLNAALYGITYGLFLYNREKSWKNIILCVLLQMVVIDMLLGSVWAWMFTNLMLGKSKAFIAVLLPRLIDALITAPVKAIVIKALAKVFEHTPYLNRITQ